VIFTTYRKLAIVLVAAPGGVFKICISCIVVLDIREMESWGLRHGDEAVSEQAADMRVF